VASLEQLVLADDVDAVWLVGPNHARVESMRTICDLVRAGHSHVVAVACEKPLGRTLAEAREVLRLAEVAGLLHAYLENQIYAPAVDRGRDILWNRAAAIAGRPYAVRASEEHSGPHRPWFWRGQIQGGGALLDMMCHSVEVGRYLLTRPGADRATLVPVSATARTATLKWSRPAYLPQWRERAGLASDSAEGPPEDIATGTLELRDQTDGTTVLVEARTSWAYVGPGLRIEIEVLGPEYSMAIDTLKSPLSLFLSRSVSGGQGEDLVEKQNAEQGLMPILEDEAATYGYVAEDRDVVSAFRERRPPRLSFSDGASVVELLMAFYKSAELGRTVLLPDPELASYVPMVARSNG
jgi:predicted dehydrogenase